MAAAAQVQVTVFPPFAAAALLREKVRDLDRNVENLDDIIELVRAAGRADLVGDIADARVRIQFSASELRETLAALEAHR